jgi:virginiamycin B lyase
MLATILLLCVPPLPSTTPLSAPQDTVEIQEWLVPWPDTRPRDPYVGLDGLVWFVGQKADYVASFDPETEEFRRYPLPVGAGPHNVVTAPDGTIWYTGNLQANIAKLDPATGAITTIPMPDSTLVFDAWGTGWFTVQHGNMVGRFEPETQAITLLDLPVPNARPYGIVVDGQRRPWIATFGTNAITTIDPSSLQLRMLELPDQRARPRRLAVTSDDLVWYGDYARGFLARLDPATGAIREWAAPGEAASLPYAMTVDDADRLWFVETGPRPNRLVGFDPRTELFFSVTAIPSGGGSVRHMVFHEPTRTIWFGTDANTIGRARVP